MTTKGAENNVSDYFPENKSVQLVPTGCKVLDCALGGGWPLGRVINIVGDKSTGKTLLAIEAMANFKIHFPETGIAIYNETEAAFDVDYAESLGIDMSSVELISDCYTVENLFESITNAIKSAEGAPMLYVLDSLDALSDESEMTSDFGAGSYGTKKAQRLSKFFRQINKLMHNSNFTLMIVSQIRDNVGVVFGKKHVRSGGRALDFYCTSVVWLSHLKRISKRIKGVDRVIGVRIKAVIEKNKIAPPFRQAEFNILFGYGVDDLAASFTWLDEVCSKKGLVVDYGEIAEGATSIKDLQKISCAIDSHSDYLKFGKNLNVFVKKRWHQIEESFAPRMRKY